MSYTVRHNKKSVGTEQGGSLERSHQRLSEIVSFGFVTALGVPRIQPSFEECSRGCVVLRHLRCVRLAHQKLML